jgi:hypothetical protein
MLLAFLTTFNANRKEPLSVLLERIHAAFLASGLGEPVIRFSFSDAPIPGFVSSVDRVLKRHPDLERFTSTASTLPGSPPVRQISNGPVSPAAGEAVAFPTLLAIAAGVPRSFPFHNLSIQFRSPAFGSELTAGGLTGPLAPGVIVGDSWWVNGRMRSLTALTMVDADPASKKLPPPSGPVAAVLAACGKAKSTVQVPLAAGSASATAPSPAVPSPEIAQAVADVMRDYRARLPEIIDRAALPHDLPPALEALTTTALGETTGPKKPVLLRAFQPLGYDCHAGSGTFTLRRRTPGHLTVEIALDVGTWSRSLTAFFKVQGLGFAARLPLPVSQRAIGGGQYPIGGAERWQQIVDNLAALVAEYDRTFVPAVEAASGPSPEWYKPES